MQPAGPPPIDTAAFREVMGRFPTGVVVVAARSLDGPYLMTANSFTSVSLDPLLVLVCIERSSRFHRAVVAAGEWGVSVLADDQEHASRLFARSSRPAGRIAVPHRIGPRTGAALLDGAVAQLECRTVAEHPGGDHTILVGSVLDAAITRDGVGPLMFHRGSYGL